MPELQVTTPDDLHIRLVHSFNAPRQLVYDAYTKPALVRRWLLGPPGWEMIVCEIDLRVGGAFRYLWRHAGGEEMGQRGSFRELRPPERIAGRERFDGDDGSGETLSTLDFAEEGAGTRMTQVLLYRTREARDAALRFNMVEGMKSGFDRLDDLLADLAAN